MMLESVAWPQTHVRLTGKQSSWVHAHAGTKVCLWFAGKSCKAQSWRHGEIIFAQTHTLHMTGPYAGAEKLSITE